MNKQIEVLGNDINAYTPCPMRPIDCDILAQELYEVGYRRQEDVAREIFAELKTVMMDEYRYPIIAELKKKYGVEQNNA